MEVNKGWRPTVKSPETLKKLEEAFALDCTIEEACFYADITPKTYYNWIADDEVLLHRLVALRNRPVLTARKTVVDKIWEDAELALKYLERKRKGEFSLKTETENANTNVDVSNDLTSEQKLKIASRFTNG